MGKRAVMFPTGLTEPGGASRRSNLLAEGLIDRGWSVRGTSRAGSLRSIRLVKGPGLRVVEVGGFGLRRLGGLLFILVALPLGLIQGSRATVFISIQLTSQSTVAALCSFIVRKPFIAFLTTGGSVSEIEYILSRRTHAVRKRLLSRASYVVVQTEEARESAAKLVDPRKVVVLPNPVRLGRRPPLRGLKKAVFTGRFSVEKNLTGLLKAWSPIAARWEDAELVLVGTGGGFRSVEPELRRMVRDDNLLSRSVSFVGWVPNPDHYVGEADVFVFPSLSEGLSNSLLEACALGRLVVASDISANRAVLGDDYPLLFPADDHSALSTALESAFSDEGVRAEALARVESVIDGYSIQNVAERLEQLILNADRSRSHDT